MTLHNDPASLTSASRDKIITLQTIPMPFDTVDGNYISAGWLLAEMDKAGGKRASVYTGMRTVTIGIAAMSFHHPVFVGDVVVFETEILRQGRSSLTVGIEASAERRDGTRQRVTTGQFTFVATDGGHRAVAINAEASWQKDGYAPPSIVATKPVSLPPSDAKLALRAIPTQKDTNYLGDVFGGWILAQMDQAGALQAARQARRIVASVGLEAMTFHKPVFVGDEVSFYTQLVKTGRTSVTIAVETWAHRRLTDQLDKVTGGLFTYVALDKHRHAVALASV